MHLFAFRVRTQVQDPDPPASLVKQEKGTECFARLPKLEGRAASTLF